MRITVVAICSRLRSAATRAKQKPAESQASAIIFVQSRFERRQLAEHRQFKINRKGALSFKLIAYGTTPQECQELSLIATDASLQLIHEICISLVGQIKGTLDDTTMKILFFFI